MVEQDLKDFISGKVKEHSEGTFVVPVKGDQMYMVNQRHGLQEK